ncbi:hypothetical protein ACA910_019628 [Epithemia clementina (nom. ined.)]
MATPPSWSPPLPPVASSLRIVEPRKIVARGLCFLKLDPKNKCNKEKQLLKFRKHYGSHPLTLASQWYDMCHTDIEKAKVSGKEVTRGVKMFLCAHYFLWNYTQNADQVGDTFSMCSKYGGGKHLWSWIMCIAALESNVIFWPTKLNCADSEVNAISIDGTDKKTWGKKHKTEFLPYDRQNYSQKHSHGGVKYQVTLCAQRQQCVHIYGPVHGGMSDQEMLERSGILKQLKTGKLANANRGYINQKFVKQVSWPNLHDSKEVNNLKSRIRLQHETFNGKMSFFGCLNQT